MRVRASVLLAISLALTACGPSASGSPTGEASSSVPASLVASAPEPTASVDTTSPTATPTAGTALGPDTIAEVLVTDLVVRSAPGVEADSEILDGRLSLDQRLYVIEGPVSAGGYAWYLVAAIEASPSGWVAAASREGEPWLRRIEPTCPGEETVASIAEVPPEIQLYCLRGRELTLRGVIQGFCSHGDPVIQEPSWLANYRCLLALPGTTGEVIVEGQTIGVHFDPDRLDGMPPFIGEAEVVGRYDAPVAGTCQFVEGAEDEFGLRPLDSDLLIFHCRTGFVVEAVTRR